MNQRIVSTLGDIKACIDAYNTGILHLWADRALEYNSIATMAQRAGLAVYPLHGVTQQDEVICSECAWRCTTANARRACCNLATCYDTTNMLTCPQCQTVLYFDMDKHTKERKTKQWIVMRPGVATRHLRPRLSNAHLTG